VRHAAIIAVAAARHQPIPPAAFALALAFGLGCKDMARDVVLGWLARKKER
jgi:hypothetical protein